MASSHARPFTQAALYEVEASRTPAFVKFTPANCEACVAIDTSPFWTQVAAQAGAAGIATVWSARCTEPPSRAVCKDRGLAFEEDGVTAQPLLTAPTFEVWTGAQWRRYAGARGLQHLMAYFGEQAYYNDADLRHTTLPETDASNPLAYAMAKHAARSPQNDWASLGAPWPEWEPCNARGAYERLCAPVERVCTTRAPDGEGTSGLGNALFRYAETASRAFARG